MIKCSVCSRDGGGNDLRMGVCFDCAEAEEIIQNGIDMFDKPPKGQTEPAGSAMKKLKFLIEKGWQFGNRK